MNAIDAYNNYESYVLKNIDPVDMTEAMDLFNRTLKYEKWSLEYTHGYCPLSDKIDSLLRQWSEENNIDFDTFFDCGPGCGDRWMVRNLPGHYGWVMFHLFQRVLRQKGLLNDEWD